MTIPDILTNYIADYNGCWRWLGYLSNYGYGLVVVKDRKLESSHRVFYQELIGDIPKDLVIDHLCRVRDCVNPSHMELVTVRENTLRGIGFCANNYKKTHCIHGHELKGKNLLPSPLRKYGKRKCKTCWTKSNNKYLEKIRQLSH